MVTSAYTGELFNDDGKTPTGYAQPALTADPSASATGAIQGQAYFTGGADAVGQHGGQQDAGYQPAKSATFSLGNFHPASGSGFTLYLDINRFHSKTYIWTNKVYFKFIAGTSAPQWDPSGTYLTIGKDATVQDFQLRGTDSFSLGMTLTYGQGNLLLTADPGAAGNHFYVTDGVAEGTKQYQALSSLTQAGVKITNQRVGANAANVYHLDVSQYQTTDAAVLETFIQDLRGKSFLFPVNLLYDKTYFLDFLDSGHSPHVDSLRSMDEATWVDLNINGRHNYVDLYRYANIDLNDLRSNVLDGGETIANAFADLVAANAPSPNQTVTKLTDANGDATELYFQSIYTGGAPQALYILQSTLRHYDLDYGTWFQNNAAKLAGGVASYLDGKGFRAYCATDSAEWFNFAFHNGSAEDRPTNPHSNETIRTIDIDVSGVTDASSLVKAIYEQAEPQLQKRNHYMHLAANYDTGVLTLYDDRRYELRTTDWPDLQEKGAKIADGCYYNPLEGFRDIHGGHFIIQHTDKADFNIRLTIPRTTMNEIFGYDPTVLHPEDFNVLTEENRELLLGKQGENGKSDVQGKLDEGLEYLLSAITLVGAQTKRLEYADANIITDQESTTASESTIRDADMAKEMTQYTKANVLAQAAQSMLAQANQQNENMLGLLP